jgi:hypothetical protein
MIEIQQVNNGYIVRDTKNPSVETMKVFQTMAELLKYVSEHFTYRQQDVLTDGPF